MRSYLYVPGNAPDKLDKALTRGADALIVDLEDAVPLDSKEQARQTVASWLTELRPPELRRSCADVQDDTPIPDSGSTIRARSTEVWVRINAGEMGHADVREVLRIGVSGVCVAKAGSAGELRKLDEVLAGAERAAGITVGATKVVPLLETASAVLAAAEIARAPRVARLQLGEADLAADLGVTPGPDERELLWVRSHAVLASAAAGIDPPVAPVSVDFRDLGALRESTLALRRLGFVGRACIHPAQLAVVHEVFTPAAGEIAAAEDLLSRYDAALAAGSGVCLDAHGRLVDEAVVRSARRLLRLARS